MPKMNADDTAKQEGLENIQCCLGSALVYLKLVDLRIRLAAGSQAEMLVPAIDDLASAFKLIRQAQAGMSCLTPTIPRAHLTQ